MQNSKSRRLRKKLHLDEFATFGFEFSCDLNLKNESEFDLLLNQLLEFIENRDLCMGGGGNIKSFSAFICSGHRYGSASDDDRDVITTWLESNKTISNIVVGQLVDENHVI